MPQFSLQEYTQKKDDVFKVEQHLLRLINFDFQTVGDEEYQQCVSFEI